MLQIADVLWKGEQKGGGLSLIPSVTPTIDSFKKLLKFSKNSNNKSGGIPFLPLPHHLVDLVSGTSSAASTRMQSTRTGTRSTTAGSDDVEKPVPNLLHRVKDSIGGSMKRLYKARSDLQQMVMNKDGNAYASPNFM